ncbi:MAG: hypothetical protein A2Y53_09180 [Chloroflexi bacterium RBG_16_47_49]|nr:MAG: hypothetical protein A2Y53_09180 [Chloroflexi bacterium RBG_16_47_49]
MDTLTQLKSLSSQMFLEPAEETGCPKLESSNDYSGMISHAALPNGKRINLLKTLLTSACERDCYYCPFRAGRDFRRATLKPEEMAHTFLTMHQAGAVEGLFLSSGIIKGGIATQDKLIATAEILRLKLGFKGYLHLKIMPGAEYTQVERAMQLADRVSINLEAPTTQRLEKLAPHKEFIDELLQPLRWVNQIRNKLPAYQGWNHRWPSSVTQFVVGGAGESDLELLQTTEYLYRELRLRRAYFSSFSPIPDTPLENLAPTTPQREQRLYEASFLLRDYGFSVEELPFEESGNLPGHLDPKLAWAMANLSDQPIEVNQANRQELLRIPGIGPKGAMAILSARRQGRLKELKDLRQIGVNPARAIPFILINGQQLARQLALF